MDFIQLLIVVIDFIQLLDSYLWNVNCVRIIAIGYFGLIRLWARVVVTKSKMKGFIITATGIVIIVDITATGIFIVDIIVIDIIINHLCVHI